MSIKWSGKDGRGIWKRNFEEETFLSLYNLLIEEDVINSDEYDVYDHAVLEKYGKTEDDPEFQDEDDYLDYDKVQKFIESKPDLTDEELWSLISSQNGNAYYQSFKRWDEDAEHYVEISENDFDAYGKYKY